jgi:hypothetical protein
VVHLQGRQVNFNLRDLLSRAGVPGYFPAVFGSEQQQQGMPDHLIQALGRWSNAAYLQYIRTSPGPLSNAVAKL